MFVNGWRPVTARYENSIGVNVSPAKSLERPIQAPLHPVLGKLQEHMAASERLTQSTPQPRPKQTDYSVAPSLLGSFAVFSSPVLSKHRLELPLHELKTLSTEREYSFLVPPPRDALRFEIESALKKTPLNDPFGRSSQFIPQSIKPDPRVPTYYIKPASYSTSVNPYSPVSHFVNAYNPQPQPQSQQQQQQQQAIKASNDAKQIAAQQNAYNRFQQVPPQQYYNQVNHPNQYKQSYYERNPGFLVHESHEVSYATPSSTFKYRPYQFEQAYPTSTATPSRPDTTKYNQQQTPSSARPIESFKQYKEIEKSPANPFYITDFQKTRYTPDINEVLPKVNQPIKFSQTSTPNLGTTPPYRPDQQKVVYVRPELQQPQYQSSIIPLNINQRPPEVEYETPESISLKHFNEQQFLLQQQLIQQDRQRLREQEKRRQQELLRQQQDELQKRQQEIKLLEQREKEKQRFEQQQQQQLQQQTVTPDIVKEVPAYKPVLSYSHPMPPAQEDQQRIIPKDHFRYVHPHQQQVLYKEEVQTTPQAPFEPSKEVTIQKFEQVVTPASEFQSTTQEEFQPVIRPYRPQKPLRTDQPRRRKPTTIMYDPVPTEAPTFFSPETQEASTGIPIQTTTPELTTIPPTTERIVRTRRPGGSAYRRRKPHTTTQEPSSSSQEYEDEVTRYNTPENQDFEKKKRVKPSTNSNSESSSERRPIRKRPISRVKGHKDSNEADLPERARTTSQPYREISATENYPAPFLKELYSSDHSSNSDRGSESPQEVSTESIPTEYYETTVSSNQEYYEPTRGDFQEQYTQKEDGNSAFDHVFTRTEVNFIESTSEPPTPLAPITLPATTTTVASTTTTTTEAPPAPTSRTTAQLASKATVRGRPARYGNATRPRFSIKDYQTRMEYKNKLAQASSTETSVSSTASPPKRGFKAQQQRQQQQQQSSESASSKEPSNRYKYNPSRTSFRASSTTQSSVGQADDSTTERTRFTPKKRINSSNYYRARSTTPRSNQEGTGHESSLNGPVPVIRKRIPGKLPRPHYSGSRTEAPESQSAAETGSFATTTTTMSNSASGSITNSTPEENELEPQSKPSDHSSIDLSDVTMDENVPVDEKENYPPVSEAQPLATTATKTTTTEAAITTLRGSPVLTETTTSFDFDHEQDLFAKASQSVADLTSSASALYDKPGMFKAVSPAAESRLISTHLRIPTDDATLPIEAVFQKISKKN
ncbi:hypothetical protein QAD02_005861 [Eretmocerus hayati]|uniref:Uncharacterized protein n=1 Tax=Eretmocerus hayati TaxID=131215 RepID=A0ACC2NWC8_9HYME|nr:hypothetical protein QAD02_005861 [Eretmocerus hayati]